MSLSLQAKLLHVLLRVLANFLHRWTPAMKRQTCRATPGSSPPPDQELEAAGCSRENFASSTSYLPEAQHHPHPDRSAARAARGYSGFLRSTISSIAMHPENQPSSNSDLRPNHRRQLIQKLMAIHIKNGRDINVRELQIRAQAPMLVMGKWEEVSRGIGPETVRLLSSLDGASILIIQTAGSASYLAELYALNSGDPLPSIFFCKSGQETSRG